MEIVIDSREQRPLFDEGIRFGMMVGDYTTRRLLNTFSVERKSLQDLCGTLCGGHARFRRQLLRAKVNGIKLVMVIEGRKRDFIMKRFPDGHRRKIEGETLGRIIDTIEHKYKVPVYWCPSRDSARNKILFLLRRQESLLPKRVANNRAKKSPNKKAKNS